MLLAQPEDIAAAEANELPKQGNGFEVKSIVSDISTGSEIAALLGQ